jgi:hypothetical protein
MSNIAATENLPMKCAKEEQHQVDEDEGQDRSDGGDLEDRKYPP